MNKRGVNATGQGEQDSTSEFLKPTRHIDCDNPKIVAKARELTAGCDTNAEKAKALFEFVRDSHNENRCESYVASDVLKCGGNLCYQRAILLTALCRAVEVPARLHLQKCTIKNRTVKQGIAGDVTFAHGLTGILLNGEWHLYEPVGNRAKWVQWTQDEKRGSEMPVKFRADRDCLFTPDEKIVLETLPNHFADRTPAMVKLIESMNKT